MYDRGEGKKGMKGGLSFSLCVSVAGKDILSCDGGRGREVNDTTAVIGRTGKYCPLSILGNEVEDPSHGIFTDGSMPIVTAASIGKRNSDSYIQPDKNLASGTPPNMAKRINAYQIQILRDAVSKIEQKVTGVRSASRRANIVTAVSQLSQVTTYSVGGERSEIPANDRSTGVALIPGRELREDELEDSKRITELMKFRWKGNGMEDKLIGEATARISESLVMSSSSPISSLMPESAADREEVHLMLTEEQLGLEHSILSGCVMRKNGIREEDGVPAWMIEKEQEIFEIVKQIELLLILESVKVGAYSI